MVNRGINGWRVQPPTTAVSAMAAAPMVAAAGNGLVGGERDEEYWRRFDNSVNAVSFGFVATAILISMFLVMAIFERFLRPPRSDHSTSNAAAAPPPSHPGYLGAGGSEFRGMFEYPSPKVMVSSTDISVLMPGEDIPTFIAHAAAAAPPPTDPVNVSSCPPSTHGLG